MSAKLIAEYDVADHLVVYSEGRISIWQREASARPPRPRIRVRLDDDSGLQRSIEANAARKAQEAARLHEESEVAAQRARFKARVAEMRKIIYG